MLKRALAIQPDYAKAHNNLADIFAGQENFNEAEDYYRKTVDAAPESPEPYKGATSIFSLSWPNMKQRRNIAANC